MKLIKLGAAVLNQTPLAWDQNKANILATINIARENGVSILCLPELCISGYGCEDAFYSPGLLKAARQILAEIIPQTEGMIVSLGIPLQHSGGLFNTACLVVNGDLVGFVAKQNLAGEGIHYEQRWFKPWPEGVRTETTFGSQRYPLGDLMFDCGGVRIGFEICEDAWTAERPGTDLALQGVDIILNPSASHFAFGKHAVRRRLVLEGSRAFQVSYVYANLVGNEAGRAIYDGDAMIASGGTMLANASRFTYRDFQVTAAVCDIDATRIQRSRHGSFQPAVEESKKQCITVPFTFLEAEPEPMDSSQHAWETSEHLKEEEFTRAIALGLFDYMRKSQSRGFVVSLSGGADSAAVAILTTFWIRFGMDEIGPPGLAEKLSYMPELTSDNQKETVIEQLLTCVYQSTCNSSDTTRNAARDVAQALGARFIELDVDSIVQRYTNLVSEAIGRELTWDNDDLALQNIQARVRSPSVWMLANLQGALLLSTSNRSEAAVGYATMDGDTSGGLSPIAGIDKAFLRRWLKWLEHEGPDGLEPIPALAAVNRQAPTAELRPQTASQTDEEDLMPYDVLDAIERSAIRDKLTPPEVFQVIQAKFHDYQRVQLAVWVERFFRLWCRNQWKRERYAPSFHVDDENLDPKTWCRFPIFSGNFERELAELRRSAGL